MAGPGKMTMDEMDRRLLNLLQTDFPLVARPFAALAERLGIPEEAVLERVGRLKVERIIRQISAIFDSRALGYQSALAAFQVEPEYLDQVAAAISQHPGVSHNYARTHPYNLWFTITVPPGSNPQEEVERLARENGMARFLYLPTLRTFKIAVQFDMVAMESQSASPPSGALAAPGASQPPSDGADPRLVRHLQRDLEITPRPFWGIAQALGMGEEELLAKARRLQEQGIMRRLAAVLGHRQAGFAANAMAVWAVPPERVEEVGQVIASFPQVTHCYQRPTHPDWPYSIFSMIHSQSREGCSQIAEEISRKIGLADYALLYSSKEYKKSRVRYFGD